MQVVLKHTTNYLKSRIEKLKGNIKLKNCWDKNKKVVLLLKNNYEIF